MAEQSAPRRPRPGITHDNRFFWEGMRERVLLIQRCADCKRLRHPPMPVCPACRSFEWDAVEASGRGTVYSFAVHYHPLIPPFPSPHTVALVELEEGVRLVAELVGIAPDAITIGMPVRVRFAAVDDELVLPQFTPCDAESAA